MPSYMVCYITAFRLRGTELIPPKEDAIRAFLQHSVAWVMPHFLTSKGNFSKKKKKKDAADSNK